MHVDNELEQQLQRDPQKSIDVIIVCSEYSDDFQKQLDNAGFQTTSRKEAAHGLVYGRIRLADLAKLRKISKIESISPDSTQYAL